MVTGILESWRCLYRFLFSPIVVDWSSNCTTDSRNNKKYSWRFCENCVLQGSVGGSSCKCLHFKLMNYMCGAFNGCSVLWVFSLTVSGSWMEVESPFESLHCSALQTFTSGLGFSSWQPRICRADCHNFPHCFFELLNKTKVGTKKQKWFWSDST